MQAIDCIEMAVRGGSLRSFGKGSDRPGMDGNKNAGNPNAWTYVHFLTLSLTNPC
jgi:hypothetical protein